MQVSGLYKYTDYPSYKYHVSVNKQTTHHKSIRSLQIYRLSTIQVSSFYKQKISRYIGAVSLQTKKTTHHTSTMSTNTRLPTIQSSHLYIHKTTRHTSVMSLQRQDYPPYKHHVSTNTQTTYHVSTNRRLPIMQVSCLYKDKTTPHTSVMSLHTNYVPCLYKHKTTHHTSVMSLQRQDYPPYKRHVFTHTLRTCTPIQASCLYTHTTYHVSTNTRDDPPYKCRASTHTRLPTIQASCVYTQETTHHTCVMCLHTRNYPPYKRHVSPAGQRGRRRAPPAGEFSLGFHPAPASRGSASAQTPPAAGTSETSPSPLQSVSVKQRDKKSEYYQCSFEGKKQQLSVLARKKRW